MDSENLRKKKNFADFSIETLLRKDDGCSNRKRKPWGIVQQSTFFSVSPDVGDYHDSVEGNYSTNDGVQLENDKELISVRDGSEMRLQRDNEDSTSESTFAWLTCTRFKPPKLPRPRRKSTSRRNGRGPRIPFSTHQLAVLESTFTNSQYLSTDAIVRLAENLQLTETRVKIWFQNRRARLRREKDSNLLMTGLGKSPSSSISYISTEERVTETFASSHLPSSSAASKSSKNKQSFRHLINDLHLMAAGATTKVSNKSLLYNLDTTAYKMTSE